MAPHWLPRRLVSPWNVYIRRPISRRMAIVPAPLTKSTRRLRPVGDFPEAVTYRFGCALRVFGRDLVIHRRCKEVTWHA